MRSFRTVSVNKVCELVDDASYMEIPELLNVCLHALSALRAYPDKHVIIKSQSGDADINVLLTSLITD